MSEAEKLLKQIENIRSQMSEVALNKGITSLESIALSQELDRLLNMYNQVKNREQIEK